MTDRTITDLPASVRQRLLNRARAERRVFQELATLYAMERFLYRLGLSAHAERFILKGGLMTLTWAAEHARITRDIDLLGRGTNSVESVVARVQEIVAVAVEDGVRFDARSVIGDAITVEAAYVGVRVAFDADLAGMRLRMQVDVGFGDAVVPEPRWVHYPELLDFGSPRLLGYPAEATLAEKLHAMVVLGFANSRMKDYYDVWAAAQLRVVTDAGLGEAIRHTFARRGTPLPSSLPEGLGASFAADKTKQSQWAGFVRKSKLAAPDLASVVRVAAELAAPAFDRARRG
jgi:predicted nucleotidyltransferase component of viral defense system